MATQGKARMHEERNASGEAFGSAEDPHDRRPETPMIEARRLRLEVAVLEERLAAAERVVAEREQRIRDLRGSLRVIHAGLMESQAARAAEAAQVLPRTPSEADPEEAQPAVQPGWGPTPSAESLADAWAWRLRDRGGLPPETLDRWAPDPQMEAPAAGPEPLATRRHRRGRGRRTRESGD